MTHFKLPAAQKQVYFITNCFILVLKIFKNATF